MSDINIPGITSNYNTDKIIEGLMEIERIPVRRLETRVEAYKDQKQVWLEVSRKLSGFRDGAKGLYGFENPFQSRIASSSDEAVLTATASREAEEKEQTIIVKQAAASDRFLSHSLDKEYKVPSGTYRFTVGEEEVAFVFKGGSVANFITALNKKGKEVLRGSSVTDTQDTQVVLIESLKTGKENRLQFHDDALTFALDAGIMRKTTSSSYSFGITRDEIRPWTKPLDDSVISLADGVLTLPPGGEAALPITKSLDVRSNLILEMDVSIREIDPDMYTIPAPPEGPNIPENGKIDFEGISIKNQPSRVDLPSWSPPPPPKVSRDLNVLFFQEEGNISPYDSLSNKPAQTVKVRLGDVVSSLNGLNVRNNNSHREISFSNIRIYDPEARGEYVPASPISAAGDAILTMDGIQVQRPANSIDDLIPGVTLNIEGASDKKISLKIEPDKEAIKESIITFVGRYNALLSEIHILTRNDETVIDEIQYFTDDEREKAAEKLGTLQGDITLMQLKTRLQQVMMNPYVTSAGSSLALLAQLGISTDASAPGTGRLDSVKLRGYLEINENKLDETISTMLPSVRELFGRDQDGDLVVDSGIAFLSDTQSTAYVQSGGLIPMKLQTLDTQIARTSKDIENYAVRLERKEQQLKEKYGMMEGALENMEKTSQSLDNFSRSSRNN